ncbi:hypothetical protein SG34_020250 [Thalassomonas viridans]|uniref:Uncharacterized protein n=1 Tax=Thalassomonas viridans TaxID=137584 RepID=A0AAE9Z078_9GAMM|nr:hypothetical protein [Thalassomonas viridans]WDE03695.1 hypothetical protein SG34_020250 [Thalassomonas viridans]
MIELSGEDWLAISFIIIIFIWAIATFCFSRITVKHIETAMAKEGKLPPEWDKGLGIRISAYAVAIIVKRIPPMSIIDTHSVKRHMRKKDWYLAAFFLSSLSLFMIFAGTIFYLFAPE